MNRDIDFMVRASRFVMREEDKKSIRELATRINEENFLLLSKKHNTSAIIYKSLKQNDLLDIISPSAQKELKNFYYGNIVFNDNKFELLSNLENIIGEFVILKGGQLLRDVYEDTGIRNISDLDILVPIERAVDVYNVLKVNGFKDIEELYPGTYKSSRLLKLSMECGYANHLPALFRDNIMVEIHCQLFGNEHGEANGRAFCNSISKDGLLYLSPDYNIVYLCKHFYHHGSKKKLYQLVDIREFIRRYAGDIDWSNVEAIARANNLTDAVTTTLNLLRKYFVMLEETFDFVKEDIDIEEFFADDRKSAKRRKVADIIATAKHPKVFFAVLLSEIFPSTAWLKRRYGKGIIKAYLLHIKKWVWS